MQILNSNEELNKMGPGSFHLTIRPGGRMEGVLLAGQKIRLMNTDFK